MGQVIGEFLPLALGVAISPIPIITVILMLFSGRARQNSLAFLVGWIVGIVAAMSILIGVASTQDLGSGGEPSDASSWIKLILGLLLVVAAAGQWRKRPKPGEGPTMPGWMTKIDTMKPVAAIGLGVLLSALNPKNLLLIAGAAVVIAQADLSSTDTAIVVGVFTLIGASTVAVPTLGYLFLGAKIQPKLDGAKAWLSENNTTVMAVLLLVIGVTLFGKGLGALL
jgi:threonine/homoserine/homoserine lactone efflux protein